jgi:hypothetical protein
MLSISLTVGIDCRKDVGGRVAAVVRDLGEKRLAAAREVNAVSSGPFKVMMMHDLQGWKPKGPASKVPTAISGLPFEIARDLSVKLNADASERGKSVQHYLTPHSDWGKWNVARVTINDPFIPGTEGGLTRKVAEEMALDINREILRNSILPRRWAVVIRADEAEAGAVEA